MTPASPCPPHLPLTSFHSFGQPSHLCFSCHHVLLFYCLPESFSFFQSLKSSTFVNIVLKKTLCNLTCNFEKLSSNLSTERDLLVPETLGSTKEYGRRGGDEKSGLKWLLVGSNWKTYTRMSSLWVLCAELSTVGEFSVRNDAYRYEETHVYNQDTMLLWSQWVLGGPLQFHHI